MNIAKFIAQNSLLILVFSGALSSATYAQTILFAEYFDDWGTSIACPPGWDCQSATPCNSALYCTWRRNDDFDLANSPAEAGCGDSDYYARLQSSQLQTGQRPSLATPVLDLSTYPVTDDLRLEFCYINPSSRPADLDGISISFSSDMGLTWDIVQQDTISVTSNWAQTEIPIPPAYRTAGFSILLTGYGNQSTVDVGIDNFMVVNHSQPCAGDAANILTADNSRFCLSRDIRLEAAPLQAGQQGKWSGPDGIIFLPNANSPQVIVKNTEIGQQSFTWEVSDPYCGSSISQISTEVYELAAEVNIVSDYQGFGVSCFGKNDAAIRINILGGVAPFQSLWQDGDTTYFRESLAAGLYQVKITDSLQCEFERSVEILQPDSVILNTEILSDYNGYPISGFGMQDGLIRMQADGGTGPYAYSLNDIDLNPDSLIQRVGAGPHEVKVSDANGCNLVQSFRLDEPESLTAEVISIIDDQGYAISCHGANDGRAVAKASGGVPPYSYSWNSTPRQFGDTAFNLAAGVFLLTVKDANGVSASREFSLQQPPGVKLNYTFNNPKCLGDGTGSINLMAQGGIQPYSVKWNTGDTTFSLTGLGQGTYACELRDGVGCPFYETIQINAASQFNTQPEIQSPSCSGLDDGMIALNINGGIEPIVIQWEDGDESDMRIGLSAGEYQVSVSDSLGCTEDLNLILEDKAPLQISFDITQGTAEEGGAVLATVNGGSPPYNFSWNTYYQDSSLFISDLPSGTYTLDVFDQNGCFVEADAVIEAYKPYECIKQHTGFSPNGDGINDYWHMPCLDKFGPNEVIILNRWGQELHRILDYQNDWDGHINGQPLEKGTYYYILRLTEAPYQFTYKGTITLLR